MKGITVMLGVLLFSGFFNYTAAQSAHSSEHLFVTFAKTTHLIFPCAIQSVDHGSNGIMVQQRKGAGNILHVKAAKENFAPTSLSVVTSDGAYYAFIVEYAEDLDDITHHFSADQQTPLQQVVEATNYLHKSNKNEQLLLVLRGIYADGETTWLKCDINNRLLNPFSPSYYKYMIRDRKSIKRRAVNERELLPNYFSGNALINAGDNATLMAGFEGLHVKRNERFIIQVGDNSGRTVALKVPARLFRKARRLE